MIDIFQKYPDQFVILPEKVKRYKDCIILVFCHLDVDDVVDVVELSKHILDDVINIVTDLIHFSRSSVTISAELWISSITSIIIDCSIHENMLTYDICYSK